MQTQAIVAITAVALATWSPSSVACEVDAPRLDELTFAIEGQQVPRNATFISETLGAQDTSLQAFLTSDGVERAVDVDNGPLTQGLFLALDEPLPTGGHTLRLVRDSEERRIDFVVTDAVDGQAPTASTTSSSERVGNNDPGDDDSCSPYVGTPAPLARIDANAVDGDEAVLLVDSDAYRYTSLVPFVDGVARFERVVSFTEGDTSDDGTTSAFDVRVMDVAGNIGPVETVTVVLAQGCGATSAGSAASVGALLLMLRRRRRRTRTT